MTAEIDVTTNHVVGIQVSSYINDPKDPVNLKTRFATLQDGTGYPAESTLEAPAKKMKVTTTNTGYKRTSN